MGLSHIFPEYNGESTTITELAKELGISRSGLYKRIQRGGIEAAFKEKEKKIPLTTERLRKPTEAEIEGAKMLRSLSASLPTLQNFFNNVYFHIQDNGISDSISEKIRRNLSINKNKLKGAESIIERIYCAPEIKKPTVRVQLTWLDIHVAICNNDHRIAANKKRIGVNAMEEIIKAVSEYFNIPEDLIKSKSRKKELVYARDIFAYACYPKAKFIAIGNFLGGRNHSTIIKSIGRVQYGIEHNAEMLKDYRNIKNTLEL